MKKFNHGDIEIETELEVSRDEFIHGNIVDWDRVRKFQEEEILESLDIYFPWGEEIDLEDYIRFINQQIFQEFPNLLTDCESSNEKPFEDMPFTSEANSIYEILILFPERDDYGIDRIISEIFDICEVPSGTAYEDSLPADLQYWSSEEDYDEFELFKKSVFSLEEQLGMLESIYNKINENDDMLIKKSLILSSMSISENALKVMIVTKIPSINNIDPFNEKILNDSINQKLRGSINGLKDLFKLLYNVTTAPETPWINLRNSLAHEIENSDIIGDRITYKDLKSKLNKEYSIEKLFQELFHFNNELSDVINI
ncbi:hypothetical protein [Lactococcus lactis]|uniref:hypothetical protein n=1 Tax=Lactococcus lactis TaxID=1358 RepID=UPI0024A8F947|nr:hypothetical protein [Lactococcus lactis]